MGICFYFGRKRFRQKTRLDGKTAVITGCDTGIGRATVEQLVKTGARVIMACVEFENAEKTAAEIRTAVASMKNAGEMRVLKLNLASTASIRECAKQIIDSEPEIHLLINNAGVCLVPYGLTEEGFELNFGINYLGHFLFTCLLLPRITESAPSRIINVSSMLYEYVKIDLDDLNFERDYAPLAAYSRSKLAVLLFTKELAKRIEGTGVTTYAVHPGFVATTLGTPPWKKIVKCFFPCLYGAYACVVLNPKQGAQTAIYCATDVKAGAENGLYYSGCKARRAGGQARDVELAGKLWDKSIELLKLDPDIFENAKTIKAREEKFDNISLSSSKLANDTSNASNDDKNRGKT